MRKSPQPQFHGTRRERHLAAAQQTRRSPGALTLATLGALVLGLVIIAFVAFSGSPPPSTAGLTKPDYATPVNLTNGRSLGLATAAVTVDLWADFQCPGCRAFSTQVEPLLIDRYVVTGQVRLVFHDLAFLGQESIDAAVAARAAAAQGKFWAYHDYLYANQGLHENGGAFDRDHLLAIGAAVGLNLDQFKTAINGAALKSAVTAELKSGQAAGITSTPTLFVAGQPVANYDPPTLFAAVDAALAVKP